MVILFYLFFCFFLKDFGFFFFLFFCFFYFLLNYSLGLSIGLNVTMDFISFGILILCIIIFFSMVLVGYLDLYEKNRWNKILIFIFILIVFLFFSFSFSSFIIFYLFFEFSLVPILILILRWGYRVNRVQSAIFIFLYTFLSSLPLIFLLILINIENVSFFFLFNFFFLFFNRRFFYWWVFLIIVFMVKLPLFLLHLWLPKAHVDAPLLGSIVLAGVLLKLGGYGFYKRIVYFYFCLKNLLRWLRIFSIYGGILIGLLCLRQTDIKSLIAYSSVVHMGPVFCSLVLGFYFGIIGSYWLIISHGFVSACLFYLLNEIYLILGSRSIFFLRGILVFFPLFSYLWFFFCVSNMGCPPTFNFFSELLLILGVFCYRNFFIFFFTFLLLLRGFYRIILYIFFNHGGRKFWVISYLAFYLKNLLIIFMFFFFLFFFFLFIYILF